MNGEGVDLMSQLDQGLDHIAVGPPVVGLDIFLVVFVRGGEGKIEDDQNFEFATHFRPL